MTEIATLNTFLSLANRQRDEREENLLKECRRTWSSGAMVTDKNLLIHLGYMSPSGFQRVLSEHPANAAHESLENLSTAFGLLKASRREIIKIYGQFHAQVVHDSSNNDHLADVITAATKEVYTFSCASYSLVQAYRHLKSAVPACAAQLDNLIGEIFGGKPIGDFVKDLRKSYNHQNLFKANPGYRISWGDSRTVETNLRFDRKALLGNTEWSAGGRQFLESARELDVIEIVNAYFALADELHTKFAYRCGLNQDLLLKDYLRFRKARETIGLQASLGLVLQAAAKRDIDPYAYLARFFSSEEVGCIMCFPNNSIQQVDYMIGLKDPLGLCSGDTRRSLYALFSATDATPADASVA